MRKLRSKSATKEELGRVVKTAGPGPDYDAWARAKIEAALKQAKDHPEERISQDAVWRKFGLEH
jgi:hypothetical protein